MASDMLLHAPSGSDELTVAMLDELTLQSEKAMPDWIRISVMIGIIEEALTSKTTSEVPTAEKLTEQTDTAMAVYQSFIEGFRQEAAIAPGGSPRAAVKCIVARLAGSVSKSMPSDAKHCQHLWRLTKWISAGGKTLRLDCAGLTLAALCACHSLTDVIPELRHVTLAIAEDHCWLSLDGSAERSAAAEVATMSPEHQGEPPSGELWSSWLYCAGRPVVCTPHQVLAAMITSMDTCVGERGGQESWGARDVQCAMLAHVQRVCPAAMYPNAVCVLADLQQDGIVDAARAEVARGDAAGLRAALQRLQQPFDSMRTVLGAASAERADEGGGGGQDADGDTCVASAAQTPRPTGGVLAMDTSLPRSLVQAHWYPFIFMACYLFIAAEFLVEEARGLLGEAVVADARSLAAQAVAVLVAGTGTLQQYRYAKHDGQLHKKLTLMLEMLAEYWEWERKQPDRDWGSPGDFEHFLALVDSLSCYFAPVGIPPSLSAHIMKIARAFPAHVRATAAARPWVSKPLQAAAGAWESAKPALRAVLETAHAPGAADAASGRGRKRSRENGVL